MCSQVVSFSLPITMQHNTGNFFGKLLILAFLVTQCYSYWSEEDDFLTQDYCELTTNSKTQHCIQPGEENQPSIIVKDTLPGTVIQVNSNCLKSEKIENFIFINIIFSNF